MLLIYICTQCILHTYTYKQCKILHFYILHFRSWKWLTVDWIAFEKWSGANQPNFSTHYVVSLKRKKEDQTNN